MANDQTVLTQRRPPAKLIVAKGLQEGEEFPLGGRALLIGRITDADIVLVDPRCSRHHARISWMIGEFVIEDMGSSNGTFVGSTRISGVTLLAPGDKITIGQTLLILEVETFAVEAAAERDLKEQGLIPARAVMNNAMETNRRLGHENLGFLSETHGIMPSTPPLLRLPAGYQIWDDMVDALPTLFRTFSLRKAMDSMPVLSAKGAELPDTTLLRASAVLSMFAHAYFRIETNPPPGLKLPESIQRPWEEITRRMNRVAPHLSYIDLIVYNWKIVDQSLADPMRVENLRLLIPTVDNKEERIFYLTQVEVLSQCAPLINAAVRAQEAVARDDIDALKKELILITSGLLQVTNKSFMKINPNPYSDSHVDPVVWAKTVAPFAVPINKGVAGPSGTAAPIFHILDTFFGRSSYGSRFGNEMKHLREWYPKHWREFIEALGQISVYEYVESRKNRSLSGIFKEAIQAYIGDTGFLSRHRLKVYGYLDVGFKVGRSVTITGFSGLFSDRTWDEVDGELNSSRTERQTAVSQSAHFVEVKQVKTLRSEGENWIRQIVLDTAGTGIRYRPGDRVGILPENSKELVGRTLKALQAYGNEPIRLNAAWREAITLRAGYEDAVMVPLRTLLTFGRIRPVDRETAKTLFTVSHNETLGKIIESRMEDQWELWDLIYLLSEGSFDPTRLWKAHPGEKDSITRIVPHESFRMYSVSSVMEADGIDGAVELHLTVGRLRYQSDASDVSKQATRLGTGSNFLGDSPVEYPEKNGKVSMRVIEPPRFSLPSDERTPIVMFAGGTGLSPFRSFIQQRARQANAGESWLYYGIRAKEDFIYQDELERIAAQGWLKVRIAFSRDALFVNDSPAANGGRFVFEPGAKQYIGDEMLRDENANALWRLLRSKEEGGAGAYFYVCGKSQFANSVMEAIKAVIYRFSPGTAAEKEMAVQRILFRLVGGERYMQEIFTTYSGSHQAQKKVYNASELALHNNKKDGYWMVVDGRVYDLTEFAQLHPGGAKIVTGYSGMDGTIAYKKVMHDKNSEVHAMLGMYEIGALRRLDFGMEWGVAIGPKGLQSVTLRHIYRVWVRFLYNVVEMENALTNDFTIREQSLSRDETPTGRSPFKIQLLIDAHSRFMLNYVFGAMGEPLENIWAVTSGLCLQDLDVRWMHNHIHTIHQKEEAVAVQRLADSLLVKMEVLVERGGNSSNPVLAELTACTDLLEVEDLRFMSELKHSLREGVKIFEQYEHHTVRQGSQRLMEAVEGISGALDGYYTRVYAGIQELERSKGWRILGE